jgi:hypothetical protein
VRDKINIMVQGRALLGKNKLAIINNANGYTLAHELGHAMFSLRHPDNDPDHLRDEDDNPPSSGPFNFNDTDNFMYSTLNLRTNNLIRHYQWKKILK